MADRFDVAVVGSGFGGAISAFRYAAAGLRVVVLERGPAVPDSELVQSTELDRTFRLYTRYQSTYLGGGGDTGLDVLTGTAVGGGSIVYSGASLRGPSFVFDRVGGDGERLWPAGLTRSELDPYYAAVEANLPVTQLRWRHDDPAQAWRQVPRRGSVWAKAMGAAGHTVLPLRQAVQGCVHCGWCNAGCRFGAKRDVTKSYLPAAQRLGATLRSGVEVQLLVRALDRWQVMGVERTGPGPLDLGPEVTLVEADHVVLAGGTIATTLLLQRSGVVDNPHLGRHISGNADLPLGAFMPEPTDGYQGVAMDTVSFDFLRPETAGPHAADKFIVITQHMLPLSTLVLGHGDGGPPDAWGLARKQRYAGFGRHFLGLAVIGLDQQEGVIDGPEVHANPGVRLLPLRYPVAPQTQAVWDRARSVLRGVVEGAGGTFVDLARELANPQTAHPLGGARMGSDASRGVVDADGFVHGVTGLSVLDGAMVPSALGVNPSLTIAALVERAMANRVHALDRPDAAERTPDEVLGGQLPAPVPTRAPTSPHPSAGVADPHGRLPATGRSVPTVAAAVAGAAAAAAAAVVRHATTEEPNP